MLIAIAGAQGSGKTTVLNELKKLEYNVVERKTARSILTDWNLTLQEVNNNNDLTVKYQNEVLKRKLADEDEAVKSQDLWFTERTYSDVFTYALITLGKHNKYSDWIDAYADACKDGNNTYKGYIYLNAGNNFIPEHDGVRGSNRYYATMVDIMIRYYTTSLMPRSKQGLRIGVDNKQRPSISYSVEQIIDFTDRIK